MVESLVAQERDLFLALNGIQTNYLDSVMYLISDKWPWIIYVVLFLVWMSVRQKKGEILLLTLGVAMVIFLGDGLSSGIIKEYFQRPRPTFHHLTENDVKTVLGDKAWGFGFVSGHSTNFVAFALFTSLVIRHRLYTIASFATALTVAFSRIYLGVHFISDVIPGILLGLVCGWITYWLYRQARIAFLGIDKRDSHNSYLQSPQRRYSVALLMTIYYLLFWALSPVFFRFYS